MRAGGEKRELDGADGDGDRAAKRVKAEQGGEEEEEEMEIEMEDDEDGESGCLLSPERRGRDRLASSEELRR